LALFELVAFLERFLGGLNIPGIESRAISWLEEKGQEYPDVKERTDALAAWLSTTISEAHPALDVTTMKNTLYGIAQDVINGTAGVDRGSWMGGA
jgi:hypothetical protein